MPLTSEQTSVAGKSVIVTGGTTGIGRATARLLVSENARVLIYGRDEKTLQEALIDIRAEADGGGEVHGMTADQSDPEDVRRVFEAADAQIGGVDILINNAALAANSILDSDYPEWDYVVRTNLLGYMACCREALDRMTPKKAGHIVNVGSMSAKVREADSDVYVATKSGIEGFSESLRKKVNELGIKVTLIEPGLVGTEMTVDQVPKEEQPQKEQEGEMMTAEDLAQAILYTLVQPPRCDVALVQIRPHKQAI